MNWRGLLDALLVRLGATIGAGRPVVPGWPPGALALAVLSVLVPPVWRVIRPVVTLVHELGHAGVGLLCGRRFSGFVISPDMSGHTVTVGRRHGPAVVLTAVAGYPMPALVGAAAIQAAVGGHAGAVLLAVLLILLGVLVRVRSLFTMAWVVALAAAVGALWWSGTPRWSAAAVVWLGAVLVVGAWRHLVAVAVHGDRDQDPGALARLTGVPAALWCLVMAVPVAACSWWAWRALAGPLGPLLGGALR